MEANFKYPVFLQISAFILLLMNASVVMSIESWDASLENIIDGDTIEVIIDGQTEAVHVRIQGVQTMEKNPDPSGTQADCHATEATQFLESLLSAVSNVRLEAVDVNSMSRGRPLRHVFANIAGVEKNIGLEMIKSAQGFAFTVDPVESTYNDDYIDAQLIAQSAKTNIWDDTYCNQGPSQDVSLEIWIKAEADGFDHLNVNGEWLKIKNTGNQAINLSNWSIRDQGLNYFYFPSGSNLDPGEVFTLFIGKGTTNGNNFYWGFDEPFISNTEWRAFYLVEPFSITSNSLARGDIRAFYTIPCRKNCFDSNAGKLKLTVNYDAVGNDLLGDANGEWVELTNISSETIYLEKYQIKALGNNYSFKDGALLKAGDSLQVFVGTGIDASDKFYWGKEHVIFNNSQGYVTLETYDSIKIAEYSWPTEESSGSNGSKAVIDTISILLLD